MEQPKHHVLLLKSADQFLTRTEEFRRKHPEKTNVISSVATPVSLGERTYDSYFWWIVLDDRNEVVGVGMRTAPHGMLISPMSDDAVSELAVEVARQDGDIPGVGGPAQVVEAFLRAYARTSSGNNSRAAEKVGHDFLYVLGELIPPKAQGEMRRATRENFAKILTWYRDFADEAGILMHNPSEAIEDGMRRDSWRFWVVDGEIVSMAGYAPLVEIPGGIIGRVGPVFTPIIKRKNGFAGALTAALSQELLDLGAKVILYTDASNPTSNSIYQKIGYRQIGENLRYSFVPHA